MEVGKRGRSEGIVKSSNTAETLGSGTLPVLATPAMVALMEAACLRAVELPDGQTTVGTHLDVRHLAGSPLGMRIWAEAELTEAEGRRLVFAVQAYDQTGLIGQGTHERFVVDSSAFLKKIENKGSGAEAHG